MLALVSGVVITVDDGRLPCREKKLFGNFHNMRELNERLDVETTNEQKRRLTECETKKRMKEVQKGLPSIFTPLAL
jgi:hypothetical protein